MSFLILLPVVLGILLICVIGMSVGVLNGRKPIQHCGSSSRSFNGQKIDCPLCANKQCPNEVNGRCRKEESSAAESPQD